MIVFEEEKERCDEIARPLSRHVALPPFSAYMTKRAKLVTELIGA